MLCGFVSHPHIEQVTTEFSVRLVVYKNSSSTCIFQIRCDQHLFFLSPHILATHTHSPTIVTFILSTFSLQSLYDFAYTSDSVPRKFTLVTNFPKRELCCSDDGGPSLGKLALGPKSVVFMKNDSD